MSKLAEKIADEFGPDREIALRAIGRFVECVTCRIWSKQRISNKDDTPGVRFYGKAFNSGLACAIRTIKHNYADNPEYIEKVKQA